MKIIIEKGMKQSAVQNMFKNIIEIALEDFEADGIGTITMNFDVCDSNGKMINSKGRIYEYKWDRKCSSGYYTDTDKKQGD